MSTLAALVVCLVISYGAGTLIHGYFLKRHMDEQKAKFRKRYGIDGNG